MREYILVVGQVDAQFLETVRNVGNGTIKEINYEATQMDGGGGPLSKTVSVPQPIDDSAYVESLSME
jgi:hypothetical protein